MNNEAVKDIRKHLLKHVYNYRSTINQKIPRDEDGTVLMEYLSYLNINSIHNMLDNITKELATVIVEVPQSTPDEEFPDAEVTVDTSFYVVPLDVMHELMKKLEDIVGPITDDEKPDIDDEDDNQDDMFNSPGDSVPPTA